MTDFFDSWFKRGKSNSEEAAFIFNCKDPRLNNSKIKFPAKNNDYSGVKPDTWEWEVLETYYIFESAVTADWEQCFDIEADFNFWFRHPKETTPSHFYCLALNKGIQIPVPLKDAYLRLLKRQSESVSRVSTDTSAEAIKNEKPDKEKSGFIDSHPLAIFRSMENLKFTKIRFNVADEYGSLMVIAKETKRKVHFGDLGLTQKDKITPNGAGMAFRDIVTGDFDFKDKTHKRRLAALSRALKDAIEIDDKPFKKGVPRFQIHERLKELAAAAAQRIAVSYNEGLEGHNAPLKDKSANLEEMADKLLAGETEELDDDLSGFWNPKRR